jgi:FKBP-type peptidyl-prolyl cis-trans isomerase
MYRTGTLFILALSLASACQRPAEAPQSAVAPSASASGSTSASAPLAADGLEPMLPGIERTDVVEGAGPPAKKGDRVSVHYSGYLLDGTKFDSSLDRGTPFDFVIGQHDVIEGWDDGVVGMKKGGKRKLKIPPHLAYGHVGSPPKIGPDATLTFDIEMLEIYPAGS